MSDNDDNEWRKVMDGVKELSEFFPGGVVFIGGVAVYMHSIELDFKILGETSHDADFFISLADFADLRDLEEVTPNRRLGKYQLIKKGVEYDVYLEKNNNLAVPFDEVFSRSVIMSGVTVAGLEDLLILKTMAYKDRKGSGKGAKDERDIIKILVLAEKHGGLDMNVITRYFDDELFGLISNVTTLTEPFAHIAGKHGVQFAKHLKEIYRNKIQEIQYGISAVGNKNNPADTTIER